ncbi:MAG: flagellar biosynthesis anti-sigma factor FlgM [Gammaproteobacteria bacterium]|nr:flagellar biosynthesis anti-sigma factor FlgM [Gammaproteobacteria bacterium]
MAIDITGYTSSIIQNNHESKQVTKNNQEQKHSSNTTGRSSTSDTVVLTSISKQLKGLEESIKELPIVDTQRVEAIKAAINNGTFDINPSQLATKMLAFESRLFS